MIGVLIAIALSHMRFPVPTWQGIHHYQITDVGSEESPGAAGIDGVGQVIGTRYLRYDYPDGKTQPGDLFQRWVVPIAHPLLI